MRRLSFLKLISAYRPQEIGKITDKNKTKSVFILSTGRTGTKFFEDFFNSRPNVFAVHEPKPSRILRLWSNARLESKTTPKDLANMLYAKRKHLGDGAVPKIYIESNPFIVGFTEVIEQIFDQPTIIHVVRDPRDYIKSALNHGNTKGLKKLLNKYAPFWYLDVKKVEKLDKDPELKIKSAYYWKIINSHIANTCADKSNYHVFKFEDLFGKDSKTLKKLTKVTGTDKLINTGNIKPKNQSKDKAIDSWRNWSPEECRTINEICQPLMRQYGYGNELGWQKKIKP